MKTEMNDCTPTGIRLVNARTVVFTFDLSKAENAHLANEGVVSRSMVGYMLTYPDVDTYRADFSEGWLVLTVHGPINKNIIREAAESNV